MGLPRFYGRVGIEAGVPIGPPSVDKGHIVGESTPEYRGHGVVWTAAYYIILLLGAVSFCYQLFPLTESSHALSVGTTDM